ncbi:transposase [Streptomyces sp. NPDC057729]|uniref:transposase n=1 Tax=Streptomyces sp. NPDC057729 TaxID=3346230 RepID=UPI00367EFAF0
MEYSSGLQRRHRLNRGGDRRANAALYRIVRSRLRFDAGTTSDGSRRARPDARSFAVSNATPPVRSSTWSGPQLHDGCPTANAQRSGWLTVASPVRR